MTLLFLIIYEVLPIVAILQLLEKKGKVYLLPDYITVSLENSKDISKKLTEYFKHSVP